MQRWKITIEYDGAPFCGWQIQEAHTKTVQGEIEKALFKFCQQEIKIQGSGRTDAGVHAKGQIAHFDLDYGERVIDGGRIKSALNAHLRPNPISIIDACEVESDFHARFSAKKKTYLYRILSRKSPAAIDLGRLYHLPYNLDIGAMKKGATHLIGHHDFSSFRDSECQAKNPNRTIDAININTKEYDAFGGVEVSIEVKGKSFLHNQVRIIAGTLCLVGRGKWTHEDVKTALEALDRTKAGTTAPAHGLTMMKVDYN